MEPKVLCPKCGFRLEPTVIERDCHCCREYVCSQCGHSIGSALLLHSRRIDNGYDPLKN